MSKYECDRCGREIKNPGELNYIDLFPIELPETLLCDKCIESLKNWYHRKPNSFGNRYVKYIEEYIQEKENG